MKVRLLLFGYLRTYDKCLTRWKRLNNELSFKFYIHTWKYEDYHKSFRERTELKRVELLNIKLENTKIENELENKGVSNSQNENIDNIISMHHSLSEACKLVNLCDYETNINIITRPDIYLKTSLVNTISEIKKCDLFNSKFPVVYYSGFVFSLKHDRLLLDQKNGGKDCLLIANNIALKVLTNLSLNKKKFEIPYKIFAEDYLFNFLTLNNVIYKPLSYSAPFNWDIQRNNGFHEKKHVVFFKSIKYLLIQFKVIIQYLWK